MWVRRAGTVIRRMPCLFKCTESTFSRGRECTELVAELRDAEREAKIAAMSVETIADELAQSKEAEQTCTWWC